MSNLPTVDVSGSVVLIVDDISTNIDVMRNILKDEGYDIYVAPSGEIALKVAARAMPDLILLDVMMPGIDGFETCRLLKSQEATQSIPIIFVTAKTELQDVIEGFHIGAVDYILKPVQREEVRVRVRTHLQIRAYANSLQQKVDAEHEQAERFRAIISNIAEAIIICDGTGNIQLANPACDHLLGYESAELIGKSIEALLPPPYAQEYLGYFSASDHDRTHDPKIGCGPREVTGQRKDGTPFSMEVSISEMFLAQPLFIALIQDVSVRKCAEEELVRISRLDPLTNIANRRRFDEFLQYEWQRGLRSGQPLALAMIDADFFKLFNDTYGHQAGDHCLQQIANVISAAAQRPCDLASRFGGEEFTLLLGETDDATAAEIARVIVDRVAALAIPHSQSRVADRVTVSVGVAVMVPAQSNTPKELIAAADKALYQAKDGGRNRVVVS